MQWQPGGPPLMVPHAGVGFAHVWQVVPVPPQSLSVSPAAHVWRLVQQPDAQAPQVSVPPHPSEMFPQADPQDAFVHPQMPAVPPPPHVAGEVQLVLPVHPQAVPTHAVPAAELAQFTHAPPAGPQVAGCVSAVWQVVPSQQAPLHVSGPVHVVLHVFDVEHALPAGQSPAAPQPHVPPSWHT
jgi:hypothetical protein